MTKPDTNPMEYSSELQKKINELKIRKEEILFLVMEEEFLNDVGSGKIKVEHKKATPFLLSRLFKKDKQSGLYSISKKKTHLLFQSGYKFDGRRLLNEFSGWSVGAQKFPSPEVLLPGYDDDMTVDLFIGKVLYDSLE